MRSSALRAPILVALVAFSSVVVSAPTAAAPTASAQAGVTVSGRVLPPQLVARLAATKNKADPQKLAAMYVKAGARTQLRLPSGRTVTLDPDLPMPPLPPGLRAKSGPPASLARYQSYYERPSYEPLKDRPQIVAVTVDHSARQTPVKDQKGRGSCVAFAVAGAMESYLSWKTNAQHDISEEHMFKLFKDSTSGNCNDYGFYYSSASEVLSESKVCSERLLPYADPSECVIPPACSSGAGYALTSASIITNTADPTRPGWVASNTKVLESLIDLGYDVSIGLGVAGTDWSGTTPANGVIDVQLKSDGTPAGANGSHAMNIVGYHRTGGYFILKNSWGTDWGRAGYGRFSYDYMQTYANGALVVLEATHSLVLQKTPVPTVAPVAPSLKKK